MTPRLLLIPLLPLCLAPGILRAVIPGPGPLACPAVGVCWHLEGESVVRWDVVCLDRREHAEAVALAAGLGEWP